MEKEIILIAAVAQNGVIGNGNTLPWKLPDDMRYFAEVTTNHTVIMGRKSWDSIPKKYRPLPNRRNIVITRQRLIMTDQFDGAEVFNDIDAAIAASTGKVFIIGGAEIYWLAMPHVKTFMITEINADVEGDIVMPSLKKSSLEFAVRNQVLEEVSRVNHHADAKHAFSFDFVTYEKKLKNFATFS